MHFTSYENREIVLANARKLAGSSRIIPDLPVIMRKERGKLSKEAYPTRKTSYYNKR